MRDAVVRRGSRASRPGVGALVALLIAAGPALGQAPPTVTRVELTADGYVLVGTGFGTDRTKVQVFEGAATVPATSLVSVANDRIVVRSKPTGPVQHKVVVAGRASGVISVTHAAEPVTRQTPSVTVASVTLSPATVTAGRTVTGTVMLTGPAPKEGVCGVARTQRRRAEAAGQRGGHGGEHERDVRDRHAGRDVGDHSHDQRDPRRRDEDRAACDRGSRVPTQERHGH